MKTSLKSILILGLMAATTSVLLAQTDTTWSEQLYRAKFGRPSPLVTARQEAATSPAPQPTTNCISAMQPQTWAEQFHRAKTGRWTPRVEERIRECAVPPCMAEAAASLSKVPADDRFENWYRAKVGRPSPQAITRANS